MDEKGLIVMERTAEGLRKTRETEGVQENTTSVFCTIFQGGRYRQAGQVYNTCYFCAPAGAAKMLVGARPKPGTSGQNVQK